MCGQQWSLNRTSDAYNSLAEFENAPITKRLCLWYHSGQAAIKNVITIDVRGPKALETVFLIAVCCQSVDKWQSKTLFLTIFYLLLSIVLTLLIAVYPLWVLLDVIIEPYLFQGCKITVRFLQLLHYFLSNI